LQGARSRGILSGMNRRAIALAGPLFFLLVSAPPTRADELLRFKSGYEMMVLSHRDVGDMIYVSLEGGGEVGFKKDLLELLEEGKESQRVTPFQGYNRLPSRAAAANDKFRVAPSAEPSNTLAHGHSLPNGVRVGYSMHGEGLTRFGPPPDWIQDSARERFKTKALLAEPVSPDETPEKTEKRRQAEKALAPKVE
jgi:hypothetical protein